MSFREPLYKYNQTILKVLGYGDCKKIELVTVGCLRTAGLDVEDKLFSSFPVNVCKLGCNIARAKADIRELALCNPWDYFITGTFDRKKHDCSSAKAIHKFVAQWIRDFCKKHNISIKYLIIYEQHKDGNYHFHGLIYGLPAELLHLFRIGDRMTKSIADKVLSGDIVFDWPAYGEKFGYCALEPIRNHEAVSYYLMKYITKELARSVQGRDEHLYFRSRGLKKAEVIKRGSMAVTIPPDYEGKYCSVAKFDYSDELLEYFTSQLF